MTVAVQPETNAGKRNKTKDFLRSLMSCPPDAPGSTAISLAILIVLIYGTLWGLLGEELASPGKPIFALIVLVVVCYLGGQAMRRLKIPSLVGMMMFGFLLRNVPHINVAEDIPEDWASRIRNLALVLILLRAGLEVDPSVLKNSAGPCARLIFIPFIIECATGGIVSHYLLDLPWLHSFLTGFMLGAVSPAVVLPVMLKLQKKGIGVSNGVPTMVIAVAGIDDVLALTAFEVVLGITFPSSNFAWTIAKGPIEVLVGIIYGVLMGLIAWYIPNPDEKNKNVFRFLVLLLGGSMVMFTSQALEFGGAGALGCIFLPFIAAIRWKKKDWDDEDNVIGNSLAFVWRIIEPFLFGLIGSEIRINDIHASTIGLGFATLFIGLALRMVASFFAVFGANMSLKERVFVMFAGIPKATVQAAIGPVALAYAQKLEKGPEYERYGIQIVTVAVLSILITAPLGATSIAVLAPRLLDTEQPDEEKKNNCADVNNETRISIFDPDSNIYTIARL